MSGLHRSLPQVVRTAADQRHPADASWHCRPIAAACLVLFAGAAAAQGSGLVLTPGLSLTQTFTDNRNLSATDKQAEAITVISPGISLSRNSGKLSASLRYALSGSFYARDAEANSVQNALSASMNAELIDNHAFFAAQASISQQSISAFDVQGSRPNSINRNSTEVRTVSLSPSLRGRLGGDVTVQAALSSSLRSSADDKASDSVAHNLSLSVGESVGTLGWSLTGSRGISDFEGGRSTTQDQLNAQVSYAPYNGLRFFLNGGTERGDVQTLDSRASDVWGGGVSWQPTPRTSFGLQAQRRFFGDSHSLTFSHRFRRAAISYTDSRSTSEVGSTLGFTASAYELFFLQFASIEPDPVLRDVLVRNFLQAAGLDPNEQISGGFLNRAISLQHSRALSFSLQGARTSLVASAFYTLSRRLDSLSQAQDDLSRVGDLRQQGLTLSVSHRLTPTDAVVLSGSHQRTHSVANIEGNGLKSVSLSWSSQYSRLASLSVTARHVRANGATPYAESALSAAINFRF